MLGSVAFGRGRRHTEVLAPSVRFVCDTARTAMDQLGAVAVDIGPGLFTGLRVGVSTARALGYALGVPIVTATSLEVLAREAVALPQVQFRPGSVLAVVDVKRGEVAWQRFVQDGDGATPWLEEAERLAPPGVLVEELASAPAGSGRCLLVGDGAARYAELRTWSSGRELWPLRAHRCLPAWAWNAPWPEKWRNRGPSCPAICGRRTCASTGRRARIRRQWPSLVRRLAAPPAERRPAWSSRRKIARRHWARCG